VTELEIHCAATGDGFACDVTVREGPRPTVHRVTFADGDVFRLMPGEPPTVEAAERLARATFRFLLAREPKESIMRSFGIADVNRFFPEFEDGILRDPVG
jgi:hypothetical protein